MNSKKSAMCLCVMFLGGCMIGENPSGQERMGVTDEQDGIGDVDDDRPRESGGDCEYVEFRGTCTVTNAEDFPSIWYSVTPDDGDLLVPEWFDTSQARMILETPVELDEVFPCDCSLIISGTCSPGGCNPSMPAPCECDLNRDGACDMLDWLIFGEDWRREDCDVAPDADRCTCDFELDGVCDDRDYQIFLGDWGRRDCPVE